MKTYQITQRDYLVYERKITVTANSKREVSDNLKSILYYADDAWEYTDKYKSLKPIIDEVK